MLRINVPRLQFEAESILAWIKANPCSPRALEFKSGGILPVELLGEGNYGVAYRLTNFPGMVLKLCWDRTDAYPLYVRAVHALGRNKKAWMPEVYALGGCEVEDIFWCVVKEYQDPCRHLPHWETSHPDWADMEGPHLQLAINCTNEGSWLNRYELPEKWLEFADAYAEFVAPFRAVVTSYMHPGNALLDGERFVITDPWSSCDDKREANRILETFQCQSAQVTAASLLSAKNSARHQPRSPSDMPFWIEKRGLKRGVVACPSVSVPSTKSRVR